MISAVVHTYNEEKNIARCLSSLVWADEIVMIDMNSTDKTREIVSEFNVKIFDYPYTGFVEPARNFGINKARGDWIFIIDADEVVPKTLSQKLKIQSGDKSADYYRIARKNIIFGKWMKHSGWWPDFQIRFFRKGCVSWNDAIHGIPMTKGKGQDLEAVDELSLIHYNYQTIEQFIQRLNRYTSISAKELFFSNKHFSFHNLFEFPSKEFINRYLIWEGYKDGVHGLALSLLQAVSELIVYLKLWELENYKEERIALKDVQILTAKKQNEIQYWVYDNFLKHPHNLINDLVWRIKRKQAQHG